MSAPLCLPTLRGSRWRCALAALIVLGLGSYPGFADQPSSPANEIVVGGFSGARFRVEAIDPHLLRIWVKPVGEFVRAPSLATETAPTSRMPLVATENAGAQVVSTGSLQVSIDAKSQAFVVTGAGDALLSNALIMLNPEGGWSLTSALGAGEKLFGLGQDNRNNGRLDRRGVVRELWAGQQINSGNVTADYPIPFLISSGRNGHAYGIFFDNVHRLRFDLGKTKADELRVDAEGGEIDFYVIDGPRLSQVIERYTRLTGRPSLPPLWALGYWQSKCTYYDWAPLDEAYHQLTSRGFPVDVMVIDADWPEIVTDYQWAKRWYPPGQTPADKIADYAKKGVRIVMSQSGPMVREDSPTFASGWEAGIFATDGQGHPVECGYYSGKLLDYTHPKINDWLWPQTRKLDEQGISGWWLDLTEPEGEPPQTHYFAGMPEDIHNQFSLLCTRSFEGVQLAVHPDQRPFVLTRAGSASLQRHHAAVWTGDIYSDYATYRAHPPEMLNSGLSGFTWWTCDTGGFLVGYYKDDQLGAHARLYERWMQFSAFSPITRAHKAGGAPEPYAFGPSTEQSTRHYLQQRYRLLPYIYSYAWIASQTGLPLVRPLALEYQDDPRALAAPGDEYLFGRELLVAPVLFEGQTNRAVYFPPGKWIDWDYGYQYEGGREWVVAAPQNRIPVAIRAGAIIPLAPDMKNTAEKPWDPLSVEVYPSGKSTFTLYHDDGISFAYEKGNYTLTQFGSELSPNLETFTLDESNKQFVPKQYRLNFHLEQTPISVKIGSARASAAADSTKEVGEGEWRWDAPSRVLRVGVALHEAKRVVVSVSLDGTVLPVRRAPELKADVIDPKGEATGSMGKPIPHFFPAPTLPATIKAINYDKGGEGIAFHTTHPLPEKKLYRDDDFAIAETHDVGGGYGLSGLSANDWIRYSLDGGSGGFFDLIARVASAKSGTHFRLMIQDQLIANIEVPATGGSDSFTDISTAGIYLPPGEVGLFVLVDQPGFTLNTFDFRSSAQPHSVYPVALGARGGAVEIVGRGEPGHPLGYARNLGRVGSELAFGVSGGAGGNRLLRMSYMNSLAKPVALSCRIAGGATEKVSFPPTQNERRNLDVAVALKPGGNRIDLNGLEEAWDTIQLESVEVIEK